MTSDERNHEGSEHRLSIISAPFMEVGSHKIFGWSDFPCQGHDLLPVPSRSILTSFDSSLDLMDDDSSQDSCSDDSDCSSLVGASSAAAASQFACSSSSPRTTMVHHLDDTTTKPSSSISSSATTKRAGISFDPVLQVRTFDVTLGDHPCCVGGMALENSWEYFDALLDLELAEQHSTKRRMGELQLNYTQRRQRLSASTGLTSCQLLQEEFQIRAARQPSLVVVRSNSMLLKRAPTLQSLTHPPAVTSSSGPALNCFV